MSHEKESLSPLIDIDFGARKDNSERVKNYLKIDSFILIDLNCAVA